MNILKLETAMTTTEHLVFGGLVYELEGTGETAFKVLQEAGFKFKPVTGGTLVLRALPASLLEPIALERFELTIGSEPVDDVFAEIDEADVTGDIRLDQLPEYPDEPEPQGDLPPARIRVHAVDEKSEEALTNKPQEEWLPKWLQVTLAVVGLIAVAVAAVVTVVSLVK